MEKIECPYMADSNSKIGFWEGLLIAMAAIGGAFFVADIAKKTAKTTRYYYCPRCDYDKLKWGEKFCPNCKLELKWPEHASKLKPR